MGTADTLGYVSLVISIIAFFIAVAQALQQYISTADGYRKCAESVVGPWVKYRKRVFRVDELRFGVVFQTPVFFVATPENTRGPVVGKLPVNVDGTETSRVETMTLKEGATAQIPTKGDETVGRFASRVHTANDERATWVTLLAKLQESELEGRSWDGKGLLTPRGGNYKPPKYSMVVQIQGRLRNWDFMPDGVVRPYATTTVSHVAEMAMLLGLSWRAFDPDGANLRAEGNGLAINSSSVQGLGTVVSFLVFGRSEFGALRVIPSSAVRPLLFGTVETIFGAKIFMNFGDDKGVRRAMMKFLKCRQETFRKYSGIQKHLRSVNFEIIAMLGRTYRLRGSNFKIIPNPTRDSWIDSFSSCTLMREFQRNISLLLRPTSSEKSASPKTHWIRDQWTARLSPVWRDTESEIDIDMREAVHDVLDACDAFLVDECGQSAVVSVASAHVATVMEEMEHEHSALSMIDSDEEGALVEHYFERVRPRAVEIAAGYETPVSGGGGGGGAGKGFVGREDIWLVLQFRMCCWWVLHEFQQGDYCVVLDPRWKESRLPVHIL